MKFGCSQHILSGFIFVLLLNHLRDVRYLPSPQANPPSIGTAPAIVALSLFNTLTISFVKFEIG